MAGYFKHCNFCNHAFGSAPGARAYIAHLYDHAYYGQQVTGWKIECWVWCQTGQERNFLASVGQPYDYEFKHWRPE